MTTLEKKETKARVRSAPDGSDNHGQKLRKSEI